MKTPYLLPLLLLSSWAAAQSAEPPATNSEEVIILPSMSVSGEFELPTAESWLYGEIEGFQVLSNAPRVETGRLLRDFERFRRALEIIGVEPEGAKSASTLILCGRKAKFREFVPKDYQEAGRVVSIYLRDRERTAIVVDLEVRRITPSELMPGVAGYQELEVDHYRQLYREYLRHLLTQSEFPPPPWLVEGVIGILMDMEVYDRWINVGKLDPGKGSPTPRAPRDEDNVGDVNGASTGMTADTMISIMSRSGTPYLGVPDPEFDDGASGDNYGDAMLSDRQFNVVLAHRGLMQMEDIFSVSADRPQARNPLGNNLWSKQATAFVHMCLFGAGGKYREPYLMFVRRLVNEPASEALFMECFKMSYAQMLKEMRAYIRYPRHQYRHIELTKEGRLKSSDIVLADASESKIALIKGDAQRLAGRREEALRTYRSAHARGERDPNLLAALGVEEIQAGRSGRARALLEEAVKRGTDRPSAHVALARLRLDEAKTETSADGKLDAGRVAAVVEPLLRALLLTPAIPETYETLAEVWSLSAEPATSANVHVIGQGAVQFPFNTELAYRTAELYERAGDHRSAGEVARMGMRFAQTPTARERFESFLSRLPATSPAVPPKAGT